MQAGVQACIGIGVAGECDPKHLRVGVNAAIRDTSSLGELLIRKGVITRDELVAALADGMEAEAESYAVRLSEHYGATIKLGGVAGVVVGTPTGPVYVCTACGAEHDSKPEKCLAGCGSTSFGVKS
jgi:hypothetical protein